MGRARRSNSLAFAGDATPDRHRKTGLPTCSGSPPRRRRTRRNPVDPIKACYGPVARSGGVPDRGRQSSRWSSATASCDRSPIASPKRIERGGIDAIHKLTGQEARHSRSRLTDRAQRQAGAGGGEVARGAGIDELDRALSSPFGRGEDQHCLVTNELHDLPPASVMMSDASPSKRLSRRPRSSSCMEPARAGEVDKVRQDLDGQRRLIAPPGLCGAGVPLRAGDGMRRRVPNRRPSAQRPAATPRRGPALATRARLPPQSTRSRFPRSGSCES